MVETRSGRRFVVGFFVAAFLLLFLGRWLTPVNHFALSVAAPFESVISSAANRVSDSLSGLGNNSSLQTENDRLRKQNAELLKANILLQSEKRDNELLRRITNFEEKNTTLNLFRVRVISLPSVLDETVLINRGTRDGLRDGMSVLDANGFFLGEITDVAPNVSRVLLMSSPSSSVAGIDLTTRAQGPVEGQYGGDPQFKFVPTRDQVHVGDLVVTSGLLNYFPRNLLLGQVVAIHHSNVEPFQTMDLRPAADLNHLEIVQVARGFKPGLNTTLP